MVKENDYDAVYAEDKAELTKYISDQFFWFQTADLVGSCVNIDCGAPKFANTKSVSCKKAVQKGQRFGCY